MNVIILLTLAVVAIAIPTDDYRLQFVTFVHRHGDRSPVGPYPNDPYGNESIWNNGWGELTTKGKQNAYSLGKWLRERYGNFLPKIYNKRDYEVQSTDVSRTLMSAYLVLTGLYEPTGTDIWHQDIKWQPIPVHTTPQVLDNVLAMGKPCPKHTLLQLQLMSSKDITSQLEPFAGTMSEIAKHAGYNSSNIQTNFLSTVTVFDSLKVQNENGFGLPKWTREYFPQPMQDLSSLVLRLSTYNKPLQRLSCGMMVKNILQNFKSKANGSLTKKIWQYSAHDLTVVALRNCLGFRETDSPPYASALLLELSSKNGEYFVKVFYKTGDTLKTMVIPGCTEYCPLGKFEELVSPIIPVNWEEECQI